MSQLRRTAPVLLVAGLLALLIEPTPLRRVRADVPATGPASAPFLEKEWSQPTVREEATRNWVEKNAVQYLEDRGQPVLPAFYPLAVKNRVLFRSYWGVHAVNLQTGKLDWESDSRWSVDRMMRDPGKTTPLNQWLAGFLSVGRPTMILDNSTLGTLSTDGYRLYAVEDLAVPPFRNPGPGQPPPPMTGYGSALDDAVNHSRLQAYDLETGKLVWELGGRGGKDELSDSYFLAAPLVVEGKLYVLNEKEGNLRLLCLDPVKGGLVWIEHLASFREPLGQDPYRRIRAASLAFADGILVCPTNSGVLLGVDLRARSLLWMHAYREPEAVAQRQEQDQTRIQPVPGIAPFLGFSWKVTPPVIQDGKVVYTAPDGLSVICLDLLNGSLAWKVRAGQDDLYLGGVVGGKVLIVSRKACRAVSLADGKLLWTLETGLPSGRGMAAGGLFYLPLKAGPQTREPEVCAIDVDKGRIFARTRSPKREVPGNLFFHDGVVVSQTAEQIVVYPQLAAKLADVDERLRKEPKDPVGLTERGQLRLGKGDAAGAIEDLHLALSGNPPPDVRAKARTTLYEAEAGLLQSDFAAGEKYLDELAGLCKIDIPDNATARERQELTVEQQRRRADYFFLIAQGRERQSRPLDALQAYLDFVASAGSEEPMSAPEDPAAKAPRDVWVGGRIAALLAAATPDQRRQLEEAIAAKWKTVQARDDVQAVQRFVRVFGAGSVVGRDARLAMAERLAQDNAFVEAELQLLQVRNQSEDPAQAARALEALARLYTRKALLDDAAYCYRALGRDFAKTVVRDGKTGADIFQELSTDKRFLPYLEDPGTVAAGKKLKAKEERGAVLQPQQLYIFEPEGELLPFFQRQRLALDLLYHRIKLLDRRNNEERWAQNVTRSNFQNFINAGTPDRPYRARYQVVGHLAVLNLGNLVFGLDPIGHRVLWEKNLLGSDANPAPVNIVPDPLDGTPQIIYQDGYIQKLGQVCTLDARAVCLQTRDGLVAVDPYTGAPIWSRTDVAMLTRFFSDGRRIYLVEIGADGQPSATRALRAADGVEERVPDFSAVYARRQAILGHNLLLSDSDAREVTLHLYDIDTGKDAWRMAFPSGSRVLHSETPGLAGAVTPDGRVTVVDLGTKREVLSATIDTKRFGQAKEVRLLGDRSAIYLACSAAVDPMQFPFGGPFPGVFPGSGISSVPTSGRVFAFDRADGKKRWEADVTDQRLLLDQFDDLPVLIFATLYQKLVNNNGNQFAMQGLAVKIIDKATGKLLFDEDTPNNNQQFMLLNWNPELRTTELLGQNTKITIAPEK
jgi:outer membrane protein assembly factor BamB